MKKVSALLVAFFIFFQFIPVKADLKEDIRPVFSADDYLLEGEVLEVSSLADKVSGAILMESESGEVLFESNPDEKLPIASVTKIMTMLLVVEAIENGQIKLDDIVTVSDNAASMGGSQAFMESGEKLSVNDMLKAVSVSSCNDGAVALAEHLAGSEEEFVKMMNKRAEELNMTSTEFVNCTGLDDKEMHYSSARDVALMSKELISHPTIFDYTTIWMDSIRDGQFGLANTNKLIRFYEGANGLKTGSTSKARYCLSATALRNGVQLIAVVLGAPTSAERFAVAKGLLDYGFANFSVYRPKIQRIADARVWGGKKDSVPLEFNVQTWLVKKGEESKIEEIIDIKKDITAPIKKGEVLGEIVYKIGDTVMTKIEVKAKESVEKAGMFDTFFAIIKRALYAK